MTSNNIMFKIKKRNDLKGMCPEKNIGIAKLCHKKFLSRIDIDTEPNILYTEYDNSRINLNENDKFCKMDDKFNENMQCDIKTDTTNEIYHDDKNNITEICYDTKNDIADEICNDNKDDFIDEIIDNTKDDTDNELETNSNKTCQQKKNIKKRKNYIDEESEITKKLIFIQSEEIISITTNTNCISNEQHSMYGITGRCKKFRNRFDRNENENKT